MPDEIIIPKGSIRTMNKDLGLTQGSKAGFPVAKKIESIQQPMKKPGPIPQPVPRPTEKPEARPWPLNYESGLKEEEERKKEAEARAREMMINKELEKKRRAEQEKIEAEKAMAAKAKEEAEKARIQREQQLAEIKAKEEQMANITAENFRKKQQEEEARRALQVKIAAEAVEAKKREQEKIEQERRAREKKAQEERERQEQIKREAEERRKKLLAEEERRKAQVLAEKARLEFENSPEGRKIALNRKLGEIRAERATFQGEIERNARRIKNLNSAKTEILSAIKKMKAEFKAIADGEQRIEEEERLIEAKEEQAIDPGEKKQIEEKRWKIEQKRKDFEQRRWPWDDKMKNLEDKLEKIDTEIHDANFEKGNINEKISDLAGREEKTRLEIEKGDVAEELKKIEGLEKSAGLKRQEISRLLGEIEVGLNNIIGQENIVENEKKDIDNQERSARGVEERRELEKQRWQIEEKRRDIEKKRWEVDDKAQEARAQLKAIEERGALIGRKKENFRTRINEIDIKLGVKQPEMKPPQQPLSQKQVKPEATAPKREFNGKPLEIKRDAGQQPTIVKIQPSPEAINQERQQERAAMIALENAKKRIEALRRDAEAERQKQAGLEVIGRVGEEKEVGAETAPGKEPEKEPTREEVERSLELENRRVVIEEERRRKELLERLKSPAAEENLSSGVGFYKNFSGVARQKEKAVEDKEVKNISSQNVGIQSGRENIAMPLAKKPSTREKLGVRLFLVVIVITLLFANLTFWYWYIKIRNQTPVEAPK